jgi:hypothetical protein
LRQSSSSVIRQACDEGKRLFDAGEPIAALRIYARALEGQTPHEEEFFTGASSAWVSAVEQNPFPEDWPFEERDRLQRALILQAGCSISPPIFHHRIAAQHSSGLPGHLERAAAALEPTLERFALEDEVPTNAVLMMLLVRSGLRRIGQDAVSALHRQHFGCFGYSDLSIPYSMMFDRRSFRRNIEDLRELVSSEPASITDGSLPPSHILLLYWLAPAAFASLGTEWPGKAIRALRKRNAPDEVEASAARLLALRFGGNALTELDRAIGGAESAQLETLARELAEDRQSLRGRGAGLAPRSAARLDSRPHQALAATRNLAAAHLPSLLRSRRRPKVAVCVSGQLRGFRQAWRSCRPLLANVDPVVFVSTWRRVGRGTPEPFRFTLPFEGETFKKCYKAIGTELGLGELRRRYPTLYGAYDNLDHVEEAELSAIYGTPHVHLDDEKDAPFTDFSNPQKMYWKTQHCFSMMEASGESFDLVMRIRPDKPVVAVAFDWQDMLDACLAGPVLYCETSLGVHYGTLSLGDQFALGSMEVSRLYAETWSRSEKFRSLDLYNFHKDLTGHASFAENCWLHGIETRKVPIKFGPFSEAEVMPAQAIKAALEQDAAGRMDPTDREFLAAISQDIPG